MAFLKEAIEELKNLGFIDPAKDNFSVDLKTAAHWYRWQSIINKTLRASAKPTPQKPA